MFGHPYLPLCFAGTKSCLIFISSVMIKETVNWDWEKCFSISVSYPKLVTGLQFSQYDGRLLSAIVSVQFAVCHEALAPASTSKVKQICRADISLCRQLCVYVGGSSSGSGGSGPLRTTHTHLENTSGMDKGLAIMEQAGCMGVGWVRPWPMEMILGAERSSSKRGNEHTLTHLSIVVRTLIYIMHSLAPHHKLKLTLTSNLNLSLTYSIK